MKINLLMLYRGKEDIHKEIELTISLPSRKLSKLDGPDMQDTAGEAGTSS